jgi:hypothetical protein
VTPATPTGIKREWYECMHVSRIYNRIFTGIYFGPDNYECENFYLVSRIKGVCKSVSLSDLNSYSGLA